MGRGSRSLPVLLAAATLIPIGALGWLAVRVLQQDRALEHQRSRERLGFAAGRLALAFERRLAGIEDQLEHGTGLRFTTGGIEGGALYQPAIRAATEPSFDAAEQAEFARHDLAAAAAAYRTSAVSPRPEVRAGALIRLGRVLRKLGDAPAALAAYDALAKLGATAAGGQPAELVARQARCRIAEEGKDAGSVSREAASFAAALYRGGWPIDRTTFELYREMIAGWGGPAPSPDAVAGTEAVIELWREWQSGALAARGRRVLRAGGAPVLAVWSGNAAWAGTAAEVEPLVQSGREYAVWLQDSSGQPFLRTPIAGGVSLYPTETGLPFVFGVAAAEPEAARPAGRWVLIGGLALTLAFTLAAAYGLFRVTTREVALARQQTDFVSAVSHEFRTPLTSMRHLTELLAAGNVPDESRKAYYYELLANETERLHRMVESLLSFGRIEAGAYAWKLEAADARGFVCGIVEEFRNDAQGRGREIVCEVEEGLPPIRADREALARALWNLLENAGKYSAADAPIHVFARCAGEAVEVGVEDRGIGIPKAEQAKIFQKFVRGGEAQARGVRGVGIGLALVKRIMEAHGGSVEVESEPGRGSTFKLVFPCHAS